MIPPIYGLKNVGFETYTGDGPISYWNSYVGVSQMGGQGNFNDARIGLFIEQSPDLVTPKLGALLDYQLGLHTPKTSRRQLQSAGGEPRTATVPQTGSMRFVPLGSDDVHRCLEQSPRHGAGSPRADRDRN